MNEEMREKIAQTLNGWGNIGPHRRVALTDQILAISVNGYTLEQMIEFFSKINRETEREAVVRKEAELEFDSFIQLLSGYEQGAFAHYKDTFRGFDKLLMSWLRQAGFVQEVKG